MLPILVTSTTSIVDVTDTSVMTTVSATTTFILAHFFDTDQKLNLLINILTDLTIYLVKVEDNLT